MGEQMFQAQCFRDFVEEWFCWDGKFKMEECASVYFNKEQQEVYRELGHFLPK